MKIKLLNHQQKQTCLSAQALVEFALILPLVLLLILGAMDFGRMFYYKIVLTNAAREGANYLARNPGDSDTPPVGTYPNTIIAIQQEGDSSGVTIASSEVTIKNCCTAGNYVDIVIDKKIDLIIIDNVLKIFDVTIEDKIILNASVKMVVLE